MAVQATTPLLQRIKVALTASDSQSQLTPENLLTAASKFKYPINISLGPDHGGSASHRIYYFQGPVQLTGRGFTIDNQSDLYFFLGNLFTYDSRTHTPCATNLRLALDSNEKLYVVENLTDQSGDSLHFVARVSPCNETPEKFCLEPPLAFFTTIRLHDPQSQPPGPIGLDNSAMDVSPNSIADSRIGVTQELGIGKRDINKRKDCQAEGMEGMDIQRKLQERSEPDLKLPLSKVWKCIEELTCSSKPQELSHVRNCLDARQQQLLSLCLEGGEYQQEYQVEWFDSNKSFCPTAVDDLDDGDFDNGKSESQDRHHSTGDGSQSDTEESSTTEGVRQAFPVNWHEETAACTARPIGATLVIIDLGEHSPRQPQIVMPLGRLAKSDCGARFLLVWNMTSKICQIIFDPETQDDDTGDEVDPRDRRAQFAGSGLLSSATVELKPGTDLDATPPTVRMKLVDVRDNGFRIAEPAYDPTARTLVIEYQPRFKYVL